MRRLADRCARRFSVEESTSGRAQPAAGRRRRSVRSVTSGYRPTGRTAKT